VADHGVRSFVSDPESKDHLRVGIVGRIAPEKGQMDFLQAVKSLSGCSKLRFVIVGHGMFSTPGYEDEVQRLGNALGVEFTGWLDPSEIYPNIDILAVPSAAHDANPRVIMEAMSAGTCVVAYRSGGISELITDGDDGLTTERNPEALATAIRTLADSPTLRHRLRACGRHTFERRFTVQRFQREVCEAIERLAGVRALAANERRSPVPGPARVNDGSIASP